MPNPLPYLNVGLLGNWFHQLKFRSQNQFYPAKVCPKTADSLDVLLKGARRIWHLKRVFSE
jgi:hypothetical protein